MTAINSFFGTVDIYEVDLQSVPSPNWLRTNILAYDFTSVQQTYDASPQANKKKIWFADTSVVHCMVCFNEASLAPAEKLLTSDVLLLPVCNYQMMDDVKLNSGQHWSLLRVFIRRGVEEGKSDKVIKSVSFRHLDSAGRMNSRLAKDLILVLKKYYMTQGGGGNRVEFTEDSTPGFPQQDNNHDCGAFVCCAARAYSNDASEEVCDPDFVALGVSTEGVKSWREMILAELSTQ